MELGKTRGYLALGFASLVDYAYQCLCWGRGKVRDLTKLVERLPRLPATRAAPAERDAFLALVKLELPRREAKARIAWVLERDPHLGSDAEELLRAALTCSALAYG